MSPSPGVMLLPAPHPVNSVEGIGELLRKRVEQMLRGLLRQSRDIDLRDLQKNKIPYIVAPLTGTSSQVLSTDDRFL
jgi:hypothetical protein